MTAVAGELAQLVAVAAVVLAAAAYVATRRLGAALPLLLDLLLAAGLLRLSVGQSWTAIGSAAAIVVIRKLAMGGIARARRSRHTGRVDHAGAA
ncbi:MAG TPA: DUF1622 domain-containing protein [Marmoricola sp.]|nr:DUF1622 domain-containing protein [Marmoricola sp.]